MEMTVRRRDISRVCASRKTRLTMPGMTMCLRPTAATDSFVARKGDVHQAQWPRVRRPEGERSQQGRTKTRGT